MLHPKVSIIKLWLPFSIGAGLLLIIFIILPVSTQASGLSISKKASAPAVKAGEILTYTLTVTNTSGGENIVLIQDKIPSGTTVVNKAGGLLSNGFLQWSRTVSNIPISLQFSIVATQVGIITNQDYEAKSASLQGVGQPVSTSILPNVPNSIIINANPNPAVAGTPTTLQISVKDVYGNVVADGTAVTVSFDRGSIEGQPAGTLISQYTTGGIVELTLLGDSIAGTTHLTATIGNIQKSINVTFEPGSPVLMTLSVTPTSVPANGTGLASVNVIVRDEFGNLVNPTSVTVSTRLGKINATGSTVVLNTNQGYISATLSSTLAGTSTITASVQSLAPVTKQIYFAPGPPARLHLQSSPTSIEANGVSTSTISALVLDQNDNPIDTAIPLTITTSLGSFTNGSSTYSSITVNGKVNTILKAGTIAGPANLSVVAAGLSTNATAQFSPGTPNKIALVSNPTAIPADGVSTASLTATVQDQFGNPVNIPIDVTFEAQAGTLVPDATGSTIDGIIARKLKSNTTLGTVSVTATASGIATPATKTIDFIVGPPTKIDVSLTQNAPFTVGKPISLTFTIRDSSNHLVPGVQITLTNGLGVFNPSSIAVTDQNGQIQRVLISTKAGNEIIGASNGNNVLNVTGGSILFVPDVPAKAVLSANPTQIIADGVTTAQISALVTDQFNNPIKDFIPSFGTTLGTISGNSATNSAGIVSRTLRSSTTLGTAIISIPSLPTVTQATVSFVTGPLAAATLEASPKTVEVGQTVLLVITATDSVGHPIVGQNLAVTSSFGTASNCSVADSQGRFSCNLNSTISGQPQISVAGILASGDGINFTPGPLNHIHVVPFAAIDNPLTIPAGVGTNFSAVGHDIYHNGIPGTSFSWSKTVQGGDGLIDPSTGVFTGTKTGQVRIRASASGKFAVSYVNIKPGVPAIAVIEADPDIVPANGAAISNLKISVFDIYQNAVGNGVPLTVTSSVGLIEGATPTDSSGVAYRTIRSSQSGKAIINVTGLTTVTGETVVTFTPGTPAKAIILASPKTVPANGYSQSTVRITMLDSFNNPVGAGYNVTIQTSLGTLSGAGSTDTNGIITRTLTAPKTTGTASFIVRYLGLPLTVSGDKVSFIVGPLDHVDIEPSGLQKLTAGQTTTFTSQGYDVNNAPIPNGIVYSWDLVCNGVGCGILETVSGKNTTFFPTAAGTGVQLYAQAEEQGEFYEKSLDITVLPGEPVSSSITAEPAVIKADGISLITLTLTDLIDQYGNLPVDGTVITISIRSDSFVQTASAAVVDAEARIIVPAPTKAGTYTITAYSSKDEIVLVGDTTIFLKPGPPAKAKILLATPREIIADGESTSTVILQIQDQYNNPIESNQTLNITSTLGSIVSNSSPTDDQGVLTRTLQADLNLGQVKFGLEGFEASGSSVTLIAGPPAFVQVTLATPAIPVADEGNSVVFRVEDFWGHSVSDGTIITPTLSPAYGRFINDVPTLGGLVTQTLIPGTSVGTATIEIEGVEVTGDTLVTFIPGPPALATMFADPITPTVGSTTAILLLITDAYSNIVLPTIITLTTDSGHFEGDQQTIAKLTQENTGLLATLFSSTQAGTQSLELRSATGFLRINPDSNAVIFLPDTPTTVKLEPSGIITITAGITQIISSNSLDSYGNIIDPFSPIRYSWSQNSSISQPGYGIITPSNTYAHQVEFLPIREGLNQLWTTGGVTTSDVLTLNVVAGTPSNATIDLEPASIAADGINTFALTLTNITDPFGNIISNGTPLTVTIQTNPKIVVKGTVSEAIIGMVLPSSTLAGLYQIVVESEKGPLTLDGDTVVEFKPGLPTRASVDAFLDTLTADGASTTQVIIRIYDQYFNLVADGTPITVTTTLGSLSGGGVTSNGEITLSLRAPVSLGIAYFTVKSSNGSLATVGDTVEFVPGNAVKAKFTAAPVKVIADGVSVSQIRLDIQDVNGFNVGHNNVVTLSTLRGSLVPTTGVAVDGLFTTTLIADTDVGLVNPSVIYNGLILIPTGDILELIPGPAISATLTSNRASLKLGSEEQATLTISVFDAWGHSVADGTAITVTTSLGTILPDNSTTVNGIITRTLLPGTKKGITTFEVKTLSSTGNLLLRSDIVEFLPGNLDHIEILPTSPLQITAGSSIAFQAVGYDTFGNITGSGSFNWRIWLGSGSGHLSTSGIFTGTKSGTVGIQASQGSFYSPIKPLTIIPGPFATATVKAQPIAVSLGGTTELTITARDAYGNLIANNTSLNVTSIIGTILGTTKTKNGVITRTLISGNYPGIADIFINNQEADGDKPIFIPRAQVTATPDTLYADGTSQTILNIKIFDLSGAPASDGTWPTITATLGTLSGSGGTIDGVLSRTLTAPTQIGKADFFIDTMLASGEVTFTTGAVSVALINANPSILIANGVSSSTLTITTQDSYGHSVTDVTTLNISTNLGTLSGSTPVVAGVVTRVLTSTSDSGLATISVEDLSVAGDRQIWFVGSPIDGDFEDPNLSGWTIGSILTSTGLPHSYTGTVLSEDGIGDIEITPKSNGKMVRLGATTSDNTSHEMGELWLSQPIYVKPDGVTQIKFWYRLLSYDVMVGSETNGFQEWDPFEIYLNGHEVLQDGFLWSSEWQIWHGPPLPPSPKDMGWKQAVLDLTPYAGQIVELEFRVSNKQEAIDNTWVYIDDVKMAHINLTQKKIFIPLLRHP